MKIILEKWSVTEIIFPSATKYASVRLWWQDMSHGKNVVNVTNTSNDPNGSLLLFIVSSTFILSPNLWSSLSFWLSSTSCRSWFDNLPSMVSLSTNHHPFMHPSISLDSLFQRGFSIKSTKDNDLFYIQTHGTIILVILFYSLSQSSCNAGWP